MPLDDPGRWSELTAVERELINNVSAPQLMGDTARIAQWTRLSGSEEEAQAAGYVADRLGEHGLTVETIWHDALISLPGCAEFTVLAGLDRAAETKIECITHSFGAATPAAGLAGELVYVGAGTPADYAGVDARGKIALIEGLADPVTTRTAEDHGVIGHLHINDQYLHEMTVSSVWGSPAAGEEALLPRTPALSVREADGRRLRQALRGKTVRVRLLAEVDTGWRRIPLVLGSLPGTVEPERYTLLSGHLDSWHGGAMDNGSANATMLEVARLLAAGQGNLRRGLKVAFWSGHSHGRYAGSAWFADRYWLDIERNCVAHVNVDSTGAVGASVITEAHVMAEARDLAAGCVAAVVPDERFVGSRFGRAGDQSFWGHGVPAVFMTLSQQPAAGSRAGDAAVADGGPRQAGRLGWWWHTPHDTLDKIDQDNLVRDTKIYALAAHRLCSLPVLPFDYRRVCDELRVVVRGLDRRAPGQDLAFEQIARELDALQVCLERFVLGMARLSWQSEIASSQRQVNALAQPLARTNAMIMRLGRMLVPVNYVAGSRYRQDPALPTPPLPGLTAAVNRIAGLEPATPAYLAAEIGLARERSRVAHQLAAARVALTEWLEYNDAHR